jgi:hypothetical protein
VESGSILWPFGLGNIHMEIVDTTDFLTKIPKVVKANILDGDGSLMSDKHILDILQYRYISVTGDEVCNGDILMVSTCTYFSTPLTSLSIKLI